MGRTLHGGNPSRCLEVLQFTTGVYMRAATHRSDTKARAADLEHADKCQSALAPSPRPGRHGPREAPVESTTEAPVTVKTGPSTHHSPTHWSYCSSMIILARPDATVAMGWPTAHKKTSHGPPMEPTVRPSNGVGWAQIGHTLNTISLERLGDGCTGATWCQ